MAIGYRDAINWIAMNDNPGDPDAFEVEAVQGYLTVAMIADISGHDQETVARAVVAERKRLRRSGDL